MHWNQQQESQQFEQYWSLKQVAATGRANQLNCSDSEATKMLDDLLGDAVKRRMVADVPLGSFLSGGIDSSAVVAQMQKFSDKKVKTFSIGFEDESYDESAHAASVAYHLQTDHTQLIMTAKDAIDVIPKLPTIYDEPFADVSQIPTYLVSQMTRNHVTVALSGDGGDELFAGYRRYFDTMKYRHILSQPKLLRNFEAAMLEHLSPERANGISKYLPNFIGSKITGTKLSRLPPLLRDGSKLTLYRQFLSRIENPTDLLIDCYEPEYPKWNDANEINHGNDEFALMQFIDTIDYLPDDILTKVDRASMAVSLEARVPILDHRIVEFSWKLPQNLKVRNGEGKWILRNMLYQYVPKPLLDRPKKGFGVPIGTWLRGPLKEWATDLLSEESLKKTNLLKIDATQKKLQQHLSSSINWDLHLWDILCLQAWALHNEI
jgi:asparagine synthase (glutamine-hydrolysing)